MKPQARELQYRTSASSGRWWQRTRCNVLIFASPGLWHPTSQRVCLARCTRGAPGRVMWLPGEGRSLTVAWRQSTCSPRATARRPVLYRKSAGRFSRRISRARRAVVYVGGPDRSPHSRHVTSATRCLRVVRDERSTRAASFDWLHYGRLFEF